MGASALLVACGAPPDADAPRATDVPATASVTPPAPTSSTRETSPTTAPAERVDPGPPVATGAPITVIADKPEDEFNVDILGDAVVVLDAGHIHRVEDGALVRDAIPTKGLPVDDNRGRGSGARGVWPSPAFLVFMGLDEMGFGVPSLYAHDARAHAWRSLGWKGNFRAGFSIGPSSDKTWLVLLSGYGAGGHMRIEIATLGPGPVLSPPLPLSCTSNGSGVSASVAGAGHVYIACRGDKTRSLLHLSPGARQPTEVVSDVEASFGKSFDLAHAVLLGPRRLLVVQPGGSLEIGDGAPRKTPLPIGGRVSTVLHDAPDAVWVVEEIAGGLPGKLWRIPVEKDRLGTPTDFPLPPGIGQLEAATSGVLWFAGDKTLHRRSPDGAWLRYPLPEGAYFAAASRDGGAWIDGSIVGRIAPPR